MELLGVAVVKNTDSESAWIVEGSRSQDYVYGGDVTITDDGESTRQMYIWQMKFIRCAWILFAGRFFLMVAFAQFVMMIAIIHIRRVDIGRIRGSGGGGRLPMTKADALEMAERGSRSLSSPQLNNHIGGHGHGHGGRPNEISSNLNSGRNNIKRGGGTSSGGKKKGGKRRQRRSNPQTTKQGTVTANTPPPHPPPPSSNNTHNNSNNSNNSSSGGGSNSSSMFDVQLPAFSPEALEEFNRDMSNEQRRD
jgi:hypothetical protein